MNETCVVEFCSTRLKRMYYKLLHAGLHEHVTATVTVTETVIQLGPGVQIKIRASAKEQIQKAGVK